MESRKKKLLENFIRREVRKSLIENSEIKPKEYLGKLLKSIPDQGIANILRYTIFSASSVDWNQVKNIISKHHPETAIKNRYQ